MGSLVTTRSPGTMITLTLFMATLAFNATSIQNGIILTLFLLVLGALVLPLFGLSLGSLFGADGGSSGYGSEYTYAEPAYGSDLEVTAPYAEFSRRSGLQFMAPVIAALSNSKRKYEEEQ